MPYLLGDAILFSEMSNGSHRLYLGMMCVVEKMMVSCRAGGPTSLTPTSRANVEQTSSQSEVTTGTNVWEWFQLQM